MVPRSLPSSTSPARSLLGFLVSLNGKVLCGDGGYRRGLPPRAPVGVVVLCLTAVGASEMAWFVRLRLHHFLGYLWWCGVFVVVVDVGVAVVAVRCYGGGWR